MILQILQKSFNTDHITWIPISRCLKRRYITAWNLYDATHLRLRLTRVAEGEDGVGTFSSQAMLGDVEPFWYFLLISGLGWLNSLLLFYYFTCFTILTAFIDHVHLLHVFLIKVES